jgi:hypothetical protein
MNERIKELWLDGAQSLWPRPGKCTAGEYDYNLEKFAELIVKECAEALRLVPYNSDRDFGDEAIYQEAIYKHFGVEE